MGPPVPGSSFILWFFSCLFLSEISVSTKKLPPPPSVPETPTPVSEPPIVSTAMLSPKVPLANRKPSTIYDPRKFRLFFLSFFCSD